MNNCYSCTTCKSADKPLEGYIAGLPMETSHHRVEGQSVKCGFRPPGRMLPPLFQRPLPDHAGGPPGSAAHPPRNRGQELSPRRGSRSGCYIHVIETTALNLRRPPFPAARSRALAR